MSLKMYIPGTNTNIGKGCWFHCGENAGPCTWCGEGVDDAKEGMCCRKGFAGIQQNGCDGSIGGNKTNDVHRCDLRNKEVTGSMARFILFLPTIFLTGRRRILY